MSSHGTRGNKVGSMEVARLAGVSRSTVSRVFTPGTYVADETRVKVMQAAEVLGYRPNIIARSLTTKSTRLVGIVTGHLENPSHAALVRMIAAGVQDAGMASLLVTAHYNEVDRVMQSLMSYQVDALVVTSAVPTAAISAECERAGIPLIVTNQRHEPETGMAVYGDNRAGATLVGNHLVDQGWSRFAVIAGIEIASSIDRVDAFTLALARRGHALLARETGNFEREETTTAMRALLSRDVRPDAVFCANDEMAVAALDVARIDFGLQPGRDIAIAGYDDSPLSRLRAYDLTTVRSDIDAIAAGAVSYVLETRNGQAPTVRKTIVPPELVVRSSTVRQRS